MSKAHLMNALDFVADVLEGTVMHAVGGKPKKTRKARSPRVRQPRAPRMPRTVVVHVHGGTVYLNN